MRETSKIELNEKLTFGIELETNEITLQQLETITKSCNEAFKETSWRAEADRTVKLGGEIVSSVLTDEQSTWEELKELCDILVANGATPSRKAGFHVHFNADFYEKGDNRWLNLLQLWLTYEPIIYYFTFNTFQRGRSSFNSHAKPLSFNFDEYIKLIKWYSDKPLNLIESREQYNFFRIQHYGILFYEVLLHRYQGLNLSNVLYDEKLQSDDNLLEKSTKPTIEFRTSDVTFDFIQIKTIISLFGRLLEKSKEIEFDINALIASKGRFEQRGILEGVEVYQTPNYKVAEELFSLLAENSEEEELYMKQYQKKLFL